MGNDEMTDALKALDDIEQWSGSYGLIKDKFETIRAALTRPQPSGDAVKLQVYQKAINRIDDLMEYRGMTKEDFAGITTALCDELKSALTQPKTCERHIYGNMADYPRKCMNCGGYGFENETAPALNEILLTAKKQLQTPKADVDVLKSRDPIKALDFLVSMANDGLTHHSQRGAPEMAADDIRDALAAQGYIGGGKKTLAEELRDENILLDCKMMDASIKGKTFTMEEAQELCEKRQAMLKAAPKKEGDGFKICAIDVVSDDSVPKDTIAVKVDGKIVGAIKNVSNGEFDV